MLDCWNWLRSCHPVKASLSCHVGQMVKLVAPNSLSQFFLPPSWIHNQVVLHTQQYLLYPPSPPLHTTTTSIHPPVISLLDSTRELAAAKAGDPGPCRGRDPVLSAFIPPTPPAASLPVLGGFANNCAL
jgi:hypothetical protein